MKRILIYFGDEQQKQPIVEQVLKDMHADYRILQDADLNQCVANLMGLPGFDEIPDAKPAHHSIDLMLFEDASDEAVSYTHLSLTVLRYRPSEIFEKPFRLLHSILSQHRLPMKQWHQWKFRYFHTVYF